MGIFHNKKPFLYWFKVTVVLDEASIISVYILIHSGAPSDAKLFDNILKELSRRHIIKKERH